MRIFFFSVIIVFCLFCGWLVVESGLFDFSGQQQGCILLQNTAAEQEQSDVNTPQVEQPKMTSSMKTVYGADNSTAETVVIGAKDPNTEDPELGFKFQLELSTKGAAVRSATFSNGNGKGFDNRDPNNPMPLKVIMPVKMPNGSEILSMANTGFVFIDDGVRLPLDRLQWKNLGVKKDAEGNESASFEAVIKVKDIDEPVVKLTKTYTVKPGNYMLDCNIVVENLADIEKKIRFDMTGPGGFAREDFTTDMRKVIAGFRGTKGDILSVRYDQKKLSKAESVKERELKTEDVGPKFLWTATVNKYFAAIVVPLPDQSMDFCNWMPGRIGQFYNPDGDDKKNSGDETLGLVLQFATENLKPAGQQDSSKSYKMELYIGPKDKSLFDTNERYKNLGFVQTIDFRGCCCPSSIIYPLAFGILALMKWMYGFIGNYGVVIIILVFLVRLILHPITKKSQISMSKMGKLAPRAEEIKKKYANDKTEMNKKLMELYREQGASPIMGFLPMMIQMPIWIALWSAVYASIDLRGAAFLPFWITDLSMPDALIPFKTITVPLLQWKIESLNLLPILMGVAFYLQQKLMPSQANASTNPQVAQQQKMMMIMMPLLFPLMLYKAPSGVNLYIMSSTFAGVIEQYVIRRHIRDKEQTESQGLVEVTSKTGGKFKKKKPKPFYKM